MHSDEKRRRDPGGVDIEKAFAGSGHLYKKEKDHESNRVREVCGTQL